MKHPERVGDYLKHIAEVIEHAMVFIESSIALRRSNAIIRPKPPLSAASRSSARPRARFSSNRQNLSKPSRNTVATDAGHA